MSGAIPLFPFCASWCRQEQPGSHVLQAKWQDEPLIRPRPPPSTSLPVHYVLIIPPSDAVEPGALTASLNKQQPVRLIYSELVTFETTSQCVRGS
jgi:hypothetical protein